MADLKNSQNELNKEKIDLHFDKAYQKAVIEAK